MHFEDIIEAQNNSSILLWWELLGILVAVFVIFSLIIYLLVKLLKKNKSGFSSNPAEIAKNAFSQLKQSQNSPRNLSRQASFILRDYLRLRYDTPALFQTIEEFQLTRDELAYFPKEIGDSITGFLTAASELTYSPYSGISMSGDRIIDQGIELVDACEKSHTSSGLDKNVN